jgi:hypothetical protein
MSGIQGIEKLLAVLTKYARNRVALDPGSSQLVSAKPTREGVRDQVLLAFVSDGIFTENQAEAFKLSRGGNINKQLPVLHKMIIAREKEYEAMNTITQNSSGKPVRIRSKINFKNNAGGSHSMSLASLLVNYTGVMSHDGQIKLLVSKEEGPRGTEVLDLKTHEVKYTKNIDLSSPITTIMEKLESIGNSIRTYYEKRKLEQFVNQIKTTAERYRSHKVSIQIGRTTSSEIALLPTILAAKNVNDLRSKMGKLLFNEIFSSLFSRQLLNEFYTPAHRSILKMGLNKGGIDKLKAHLSTLQIDELKRKLLNDTPITLKRRQTMAITELIISLLDASSKSSSSTQTYDGNARAVAPIVNRNANAQAQSENINRHRQAQLMNIAARQAAGRALERRVGEIFESPASRPGFANAGAGPSGSFQHNAGSMNTVEGGVINMNNNAQSAPQPQRGRSI